MAQVAGYFPHGLPHVAMDTPAPTMQQDYKTPQPPQYLSHVPHSSSPIAPPPSLAQAPTPLSFQDISPPLPTYFLDSTRHYAEEELLYNPNTSTVPPTYPPTNNHGLGIRMESSNFLENDITYSVDPDYSQDVQKVDGSPVLPPMALPARDSIMKYEMPGLETLQYPQLDSDILSPTDTNTSGPLTPADSQGTWDILNGASFGSVCYAPSTVMPATYLSGSYLQRPMDPFQGFSYQDSSFEMGGATVGWRDNAAAVPYSHHNYSLNGYEAATSPEELTAYPNDAESTMVKREKDGGRQHQRNSRNAQKLRRRSTSPLQEDDAPSPPASTDKDQYLLDMRDQGMTYADIKKFGGFTEAESTLRGRHRNLTKDPTMRVRRPEWNARDVRLLDRGVQRYLRGGNAYHKVPWKKVALYIHDRGGSYLFGASTVSKKWYETFGPGVNVR